MVETHVEITDGNLVGMRFNAGGTLHVIVLLEVEEARVLGGALVRAAEKIAPQRKLV